MGVKFCLVMVPFEDKVEFMDADVAQIRVLVCQVYAALAVLFI